MAALLTRLERREQLRKLGTWRREILADGRSAEPQGSGDDTKRMALAPADEHPPHVGSARPPRAGTVCGRSR